MKKPFLWAFALLALLLFTARPAFAAAPLPPPNACAFNPEVARILDETSSGQWLDWIEKLSGEAPIYLAGQRLLIQTRYSVAMFSDRLNARAFDYVLQEVRAWVNEKQIEIDPYPADNTTWKNLVVTFPGTVHPDEVVVLSAHLDSKSLTKPFTQAPGADDNATGTAALLEAVRIFRSHSFERTVKIIFFTGEEWGMLGSQAYVKDHYTGNIVGVINLDMFGYDSNQDRCFEIHAGMLPASQRVAGCVTQTVQAYRLNLSYDYVTDKARAFSDHSSFWNAGVGAVLMMENLFEQGLPGGCDGHDNNPNYHTTHDTIKNSLNISYGFDIARAGLAAAAGLAVPVPVCSLKAEDKSY